MLETPHVALGTAIAVAIPNPLISIPLAFASHFLLDMTPHWNPHLNTETKKYGKLTNKTLLIIGLDLACATVLVGSIAYYFRSDSLMFFNILLSSFASIAPDVVEGPYFFWGYKNKAINIWMKFQKIIQVDTNIFWGSLTQIVVIIASLYWIFLT
ncbi:MAG: hypothetical protein QY322_00060 [bacterium]|nr:MAG: hypothetical protein QY322_00060 [bacterium]